MVIGILTGVSRNWLYRHSLGDCCSSKLYLSMCLSLLNGFYLSYYELDFDETWWKCWNLGPMIVLKFHKNRFSDDVIKMTSLWRHSFAKGENSVAKGNLTTIVYSTLNWASSANVDLTCSVEEERLARANDIEKRVQRMLTWQRCKWAHSMSIIVVKRAQRVISHTQRQIKFGGAAVSKTVILATAILSSQSGRLWLL